MVAISNVPNICQGYLLTDLMIVMSIQHPPASYFSIKNCTSLNGFCTVVDNAYKFDIHIVKILLTFGNGKSCTITENYISVN